jgi:hypothetical protein
MVESLDSKFWAGHNIFFVSLILLVGAFKERKATQRNHLILPFAVLFSAIGPTLGMNESLD